MQFVYRKSLNEVVRLYKLYSKPVEQIKHPYVEALKKEEPLPLRKLTLENIVHYNNEVVKLFVSMHGEVLILPLSDLVAIRGFELRAIKSKDFRFIGDGEPAFYGFNYFRDFKYGETAFIVEGVKDACAIREYYPYVVAALGVTLSRDVFEFLFKITNKWVFVHDNDFWGRSSEKKIKKLNVKSITVPFGKDLGVIYEEPLYTQGKEIIREYIKSVVNIYT